MKLKSKRYRKEAEQVSEAQISVADAVAKIKTFNSTKFDQTVTCVFWLGIDPKQSDQIIREDLQDIDRDQGSVGPP